MRIKECVLSTQVQICLLQQIDFIQRGLQGRSAGGALKGNEVIHAPRRRWCHRN